MGTRTHTSFFDVDQTEPLVDALDALQKDFSHRAPYIDSELVEAGTDRLLAVELAIKRLSDWAD